MTEAVFIKPEARILVPILDDTLLITRLQKQDESAFEMVFKTHYKSLHAYAAVMLNDRTTAEEVVQQVFFKLWERSATLSISGSIAAYLYRAVHNESLNQLKHLKVRSQYQLFVKHRNPENKDTSVKSLQLKELETKLRIAMNELPEGCRTVFQLSRFEELRYNEIAGRLKISVKTVEAQMGKALKILRIKLADFLILIWVFTQIKL